MTGSAESAIPCPNKFTETAAAMAGNPTCTATGNSTVPTRAMDGVGQKKMAAKYMLIPNTKKAVHGPTMNFCIGATMILSAPCWRKELNNATMMAIISMISKSNFPAFNRPEKMTCTPNTRLSKNPICGVSAKKPIRNSPMIEGMMTSLRKTIEIIIATTVVTYSQCDTLKLTNSICSISTPPSYQRLVNSNLLKRDLCILYFVYSMYSKRNTSLKLK